MTAFITVTTGVLVFVLGQIVLKLIIEPWQAQRILIAKVAHHLMFYANVYSNPGTCKDETNSEASAEARKLSSESAGLRSQIPFYSRLSRTFFFPNEKHLLVVEKMLIGLSNSTRSGDPEDNEKRIDKIRELLEIKSYE